MSYGTTKVKRKRSRSPEESNSIPALFQSCAIGFACALLCAALLLVLCAALCSRSPDPQKMILPLGLGTLYLSAFLAGMIAVRRYGCSALLCGALCGALLLVFFWILSAFFQGNDTFSLPLSLILRLMTVLFPILGAFCGLKRTSKRPHRKSK